MTKTVTRPRTTQATVTAHSAGTKAGTKDKFSTAYAFNFNFNFNTTLPFYSGHNTHGSELNPDSCATSTQMQYWNKIRFFGTPIDSFIGEELARCLERCLANSKCKIFNYFKSPFIKICYLKSDGRGYQVHSDYIGGHKCSYRLADVESPKFQDTMYPADPDE